MMRVLKILITLTALGLFSNVSWAKSMTVTGYIPRDTSLDYFDLEIKVTDISKTTPAVGENLFKDRLRVWLMDLSSASTEYVPFEGGVPVANVPFTIRLTSDIIQTPNANGLTDFTYNVRISANSVGGLKDKLLAGNKTATIIQAHYYEDKKPQPETKVENKVISVNTAIVKGAPSGVSSSGTHRSIRVKWLPSAPTTWSDGSSSSPSKVFAVAIDKSSQVSDAPAYLYDSTSSTDAPAAEGACIYVRDNQNCIQCSDPDRHYLNPAKLSELSAQGVFVASASANAGEIIITGLENNKVYSVFTFYTPGGLQRSTCEDSTPVANTTWSEHNGEEDAKLSDPKCFIATAAYGSPLHRNLLPLRWFRDRVLKRTKMGSNFVDWYYENGPSAAKVVASNSALRLLVGSILWLPVLLISSWMTLTGQATFPGHTLIVITGFAVFCFYASRHRRRGGHL